MKRWAVAVLVLVALLAVAVPSNAAVPGKSTLEIGTFSVSGVSNYAVTLNYRASERIGLGASYQSLSSGGVNVSGTGFSLAYYFNPSTAQTEPYIFAGVASATASGFGQTASASATAFGAGITTRLTDQVKLGGSLAVSTSGGRSSTVYSAGLSYDFSERTYGVVGFTGSSTTSTSLYLGLGLRF
jgi:hypothetical protein